MLVADFTITIHGDTPRDVRVVVYEGVKGMRVAASRWDNGTKARRRRRRGGFAGTLGVCHRFQAQDASGALHPLCAVVRFALPHVGVGIISHELAHAAVHIRALDEGDTLPLTAANDERFCWVLGELVRQAVTAMDHAGVFDGRIYDPVA